MYLSVSVSLHPSVSVDFCLYLSVSFLSVYEYLSLFSALLICVSLGLSPSLLLSFSFGGISISLAY